MATALKLVPPAHTPAPDYKSLLEQQHAQASDAPQPGKIKNLAEAYAHIRRPRFDLRKNGMGFEFFTQVEIDMIGLIASAPDFNKKLFTANEVHQKLGYSNGTIRKALRRLCDAQIIFETLNPTATRGVYCYGVFKGRPQEINSHLVRTVQHGGTMADQTIIWLISLSMELNQPLMARDAPDVFASRRPTIQQHCGRESGLLEAWVSGGDTAPGTHEYRPTKMGISVTKHWQEITALVNFWRESLPA